MQKVIWECDKCGREQLVKVRTGTEYEKRDRDTPPQSWAWLRVTVIEQDKDDESDYEESEEEENYNAQNLLFCLVCKVNLTKRDEKQPRHVEKKRARRPSPVVDINLLDEGDDE